MYREILTKAIIAKGETTINESETVLTNDEISKVLGCWIINHKYDVTSINNKVIVKGQFDAFLWYGKDNNTNSELIKKTFDYQSEIPYSFTLESYPLDDKCEIKCIIKNDPSCVSMTYKNNQIDIEYKIHIAIDIIGETKIKIKVDDIIIEDTINTDYMKDKNG